MNLKWVIFVRQKYYWHPTDTLLFQHFLLLLVYNFRPNSPLDLAWVQIDIHSNQISYLEPSCFSTVQAAIMAIKNYIIFVAKITAVAFVQSICHTQPYNTSKLCKFDSELALFWQLFFAINTGQTSGSDTVSIEE